MDLDLDLDLQHNTRPDDTTTPEPDPRQTPDAPTLDDAAVPLCIGCLEPVAPLTHYCGKCGECVGQLSPYIPFVNIPYYARFFGKLWKRVWRTPGISIPRRVFYFVTSVVLEPLTLLCFLSPVLNWQAVHDFMQPEERRRRLGLCPACEYDLRGSVDSEVCPECGMQIPEDAARVAAAKTASADLPAP